MQHAPIAETYICLPFAIHADGYIQPTYPTIEVRTSLARALGCASDAPWAFDMPTLCLSF